MTGFFRDINHGSSVAAMNKKDSIFLKKTISVTDNTPVIKIASCYVDVLHDADIRIQQVIPFQMIPEDEMDIYCGFLKKGLNAKPDSNAFEVKPSNDWMKNLLDSKFEDLDMIEEACGLIRDNYSSDENYSVIFAYGNYDDSPAGTFPFLVVMIQPCVFDKPGIVYDYKGNAFGARKKERALEAPVQTFMYPSVSSMAADWEHVLCVSKTAKAVDGLRPFIEHLLEGKIDPSVDEQKMLFNSIVESGFENGKASYACVQNVVNHVNELATESRLSDEKKTISPKELAESLIGSGSIEAGREEYVREAAAEINSNGFNPELIIGKSISIVTDLATIKVDKDDLDRIQVKVIDGEECYVIPARNATIAGIAVRG